MSVPNDFVGINAEGCSHSLEHSDVDPSFLEWLHQFVPGPQARDAITGIVLAAGLIGGLTNPGKAACLGGAQPDNNCREFTRETSSQVEVGAFADSSLSTNRWFQIGFSSTQAGPAQPIQAIEYSYDNGSNWQSYGLGTATAIAPIGTVVQGPAIDKGSAIGSNQFRYRFILPGGVFDEFTVVRTSVSFDDTFAGLQQTPQTVFSREFLADDPPGRSAPGPLPGLGAAMAFSWSRRLRRRVRAARRNLA